MSSSRKGQGTPRPDPTTLGKETVKHEKGDSNARGENDPYTLGEQSRQPSTQEQGERRLDSTTLGGRIQSPTHTRDESDARGKNDPFTLREESGQPSTQYPQERGTGNQCPKTRYRLFPTIPQTPSNLIDPTKNPHKQINPRKK